MELREKVVLVTGANGFVGTYVARRLREEGMRVRVLVRRPEARDELARSGVEALLGEVTDARARQEAVRGAHGVVHCVATNAQELDEARRVNVETTAALAEAALGAGCERFVHLSSVAVYPLRERDGVVGEDSPLVTQGDTYSLTKAEAERALNGVAARGLRTVILRASLILGVHPSSYWGTRYPQVIAAGQFPQVDGGRATLGHVHISSLTEAVVLALRVDGAVHQAFNIVDGHQPWHRYTDYFVGTRSLPQLPAQQAPAFLSFRGRYSVDKARRVLGFVPRDTFASSMDEIIRSLPRP